MISAELVRTFQSDGWCAGPRLYTDSEVYTLAHHFDAVLAGHYETGQPPSGVNLFGAAMVKVSNAWQADLAIRRVVHDPRIAAAAALLLGVAEVYLWADSLYWKAPDSGEQGVVGWHQDKTYWQSVPTDEMLTACVNLYPATADSGGMRFVSGSHRWGLVDGFEALSGEANAGSHVPPVVPGPAWQAVCPTLCPGQVTFHHCLTLHGSGPNRRVEPRRSITIHMMSGAGRWALGGDGLFPRLYPR